MACVILRCLPLPLLPLLLPLPLLLLLLPPPPLLLPPLLLLLPPPLLLHIAEARTATFFFALCVCFSLSI